MINQLALVLALLAPVSPAEPTEASDPPLVEPTKAQPPPVLRLGVEDAPDGFDAQLRRALFQQDIETSEDERDGSLVVTIRPWNGGGVEGYGYDLDLSRDGERVGDVFSQVCVGCNVEDLAVEVADHVADMTDGLPPPKAPEPEPPKSTEILAPTLPPPKADAPRRSVARPLLATGIPVLVAGCTMLGVGLGLIAKGEVVDLATRNDLYLEVTDYRPPGVALAISGGIAIAIGAVLTGVGGYQHRRERSRQAWRWVPRLTLRPPASSGSGWPSMIAATGSGSR
jgi:hypothetical protein